MFDIKRLLSYAYPEALVEVSTAINGLDQNVSISNIDKDNARYLTSIMEAAGYIYQESDKEVANLGVYEFTNVSLYEDLIEEATMEDGSEHETDYIEDNGSDFAGSELSNSAVTSIDGDGRAFRVLTNPEMHKFAMKVYTGMLGNNENMANYGIFAYDLDNFLSMHQNTNTSFDDDEEESGEDESISVPESASILTVAELADTLFNANADEFLTVFGKHIPETANNKFIGKIILGILVKVVGGAVGKALLNAWERRNKGAFERILFSIVSIIVRDWFPEEAYSYKSDVQKYKEYEFDDDYKYDIDLDDYTVEKAEALLESEGFVEGSEVALSPASIGILRLLIAVFIKIMAGALGRMLIDTWIKRDKKRFERTLMYFMLEAIKYVPFKKYMESASVELYDDGLLLDYANFTDESEIEGSETARKKKEKTGRGALLSALMRAMSGDTGDRAAKAWDNGDMDAMVEIMGSVTEKVLESMPYDESNDDSSEEEPDSSEVETTETTETTETIPDTTSQIDDV